MPGLGHWLRRKFPQARSKHPTEEGDLGIPKGLPILPESHQELHFDPLTSSLSPFFQKVPVEIRREIYLAAFGNQTLHVDLQYRHPDIPGPWHARLSGKKDAFDVSVPKAWLWWSSVCHRNQFLQQHDLFFDNCSIGVGHCNIDRTGLRDDCYVGVMGWMLSCHQACVYPILMLVLFFLYSCINSIL